MVPGFYFETLRKAYPGKILGSEKLRFTTLALYRVELVNHITKEELRRSFGCYEHISKTVLTVEDSD